VTSQRTRLVLAVLLIALGLPGCGRSSDDIIGKWRATGDSSAVVWEFSKDGSVLMGSTRGKYSFGDNDRFKIQTSFGTSVYQMELSKDHLMLRDSSGSRLEFTKLK
jgi:hypothetical protein